MNLSDTTLLLTRPRVASVRFRQQAEAALGQFGTVIVSPVIEIVFLAPELRLTPATVLALTSENGAQAAARLMSPAGRIAYCVGDRTAAVAQSLGFTARSAGGDLESLIALLRADPPMGPLLHLVGRHQRGDLSGSLRAAGVSARAVVAYDQVEHALDHGALRALSETAPVLLPVFSARSAALIRPALATATAPLALAGISTPVLARLVSLAARSAVAATPTSKGVLGAMRFLIDSDGLP